MKQMNYYKKKLYLWWEGCELPYLEAEVMNKTRPNTYKTIWYEHPIFWNLRKYDK